MASFSYQGIGPRLVAQIVDGIVLLVLYFVLGAAMFGSFTFDVFGLAALSFMSVYMLLFFLYFIVLEGVTGATAGKVLTKIRVVRDDGSPCGLGPAIVRNILRVVDALPFLYIVGLILISRSEKKQRLGDRLAKTVVIKSSGTPLGPSVKESIQSKTFCTNCGVELSGRPSFCPKCGAKQ
jgi:uncharacterized RDD family membrane protein YckC